MCTRRRSPAKPSPPPWLVAGLALAVAAAAALPARAGTDPACDIRDVPRIVAVGDVHGAYDNFVAVLQMAGIIDSERRWSGGHAHLVQTGDVVDRGPDSRKAMDLLMRLEKEARRAGGRVHALLGNHEVMNMLGDLRYVQPEDYEAFRTPKSEERREQVYATALADARGKAKASGQAFDEKAFREQFLKDRPLGFVERWEAFGEGGDYGRWLRQHATIVRINGIVFVHGGISPAVAPLGCSAVNEAVRTELTEDIAKTRSAPLRSLAAREDGPLWYRGLAREDEAPFAPTVDSILKALDARAMVVGHTVNAGGRIATRFGGRVVMIDVGMLPALGGNLAALELGPEGMVALSPTGRIKLETPAVTPRAAGGHAPAVRVRLGSRRLHLPRGGASFVGGGAS